MTKFISLIVFLNIASFLLVNSILELLNTEIFSFDLITYIKLIGSLLSVIYFSSLAIIYKDKRLVYTLLLAAILIPVLVYSSPQNIIGNLLPAILVIYGIAASTDINKNLIKTRFIVAAHSLAKAIILYFSLLAASFYYFSYANPEIIKTSLVNTLEDNVKALVTGQLSQQFSGLTQFGITPELIINDVVNTKEVVSNFVDSYSDFIKPLMSLILFSIVSFMGTIAWYIFIISSQPIIYVLEKINFLKKETTTVEKIDLTL